MGVFEIYKQLLKAFGNQNWWPVENNFHPKEWEICAGAILTQNTNWNNVEKALNNMRKAGCVTIEDVLEIDEKDLRELIKPAGFYKQKAERLKIFAEAVGSSENLKTFLRKTSRENLLRIKGIGPETADSILLYAGNRRFFVVDAYTKRVFSRLGFFPENQNYETVRKFFEKNLPKNIKIYKEFHALIVKLAKDFCRKKPFCEKCPLKDCSFKGVRK